MLTIGIDKRNALFLKPRKQGQTLDYYAIRNAET